MQKEIETSLPLLILFAQYTSPETQDLFLRCSRKPWPANLLREKEQELGVAVFPPFPANISI